MLTTSASSSSSPESMMLPAHTMKSTIPTENSSDDTLDYGGDGGDVPLASIMKSTLTTLTASSEEEGKLNFAREKY